MNMKGNDVLPDARWRGWVREHPVLGLALSGFIATQMATIVGYYIRAIGLPQVPWPLYNGALFAPAGHFGDPASFFTGQSIHMVDGVVFALLFGIMVRSRIPLPNTKWGNIGKGMVYGTVLALISAGLLVPYAYVPKSGFGVFSFGTHDGWKLPASILLFHWVYGYFLGALYTPEADE